MTIRNETAIAAKAREHPASGYYHGLITPDLEELALAEALCESLDAVDAGQRPEQAAARHSGAHDEILPLLRIAQLLRQCKSLYQTIVPGPLPA